MPPRRRPTMDSDDGDYGFGPRPNAAELIGAASEAPSVDFAPPPTAPGPVLGPEPTRESGAAGNTERPRDVFSNRGPGTLIPPASGGETPGLSEILAMLPQGVEAGGTSGGQSQAAPLQSSAPQSTSLGGTPPASAPGPVRQAISSPVNLFSGDTNSSLIGRAGGLTSGGIGMPGGPSGGPTPTMQMLELLKSLGIG